ncbi:MAG TPA: phosphopentomutase [Clostridia bacterium]|nr:phosphopentomutase [Clostridia bacterium]
MKRAFLIVLDSFGIGELPDAKEYGDEGSNTFKAIYKSKEFKTPNLQKLGLFNIDGVDFAEKISQPEACYGRLQEMSKGKDTTIGHWELAGIISDKPLPTYPIGFPSDIIREFEDTVDKKVLCNRPYSGTEVIKDYGREHMQTGDLIVYTSADSVFQIAAHENIVPIENLYDYCRVARELLQGEHGVGRVIARPFIGKYPKFKRTANRLDFSLAPPKETVLDSLHSKGYDVISVGKIKDIFANRGITDAIKTSGNTDGMNKTIQLQKTDFKGLCFVNLVDFDMLYGHRNNVDGYAKAMSEFDVQLEVFLNNMSKDDVLIITADHGCDPSTQSTDHSREYVPLLVYGEKIAKGINLGTRASFADVGATVLDFFGVEITTDGNSFKSNILKTCKQK